jgi:hypothetical protein
MFHRSLRRTLEAIVTQAIALIIALAGSDFKRSRAKQAQSTKKHRTPGQPRHLFLSFTRPRGGSFLAREVAALTISGLEQFGRPPTY